MPKAKFDVVLSDPADEDILEILEWTVREHGAEMAGRYRALIFQAFQDIARDPNRPGSSLRPEISTEIRLYHLRFSRKRARDESGMIREPRHFVVYFVAQRGVIEVLRILHDARDLPRQLKAISLPDVEN